MDMNSPENTAICEILGSLEWQERAILTLKALEGFDEEVIAFCLDMPKVPVYYLSWRLTCTVRKLLEQNTGYPWETLDAFYASFAEVLEEEIAGN